MTDAATAEARETPDQFSAWRLALATGKPVEYTRGSPTAGYFKIRQRNPDRSIRRDALAIWRAEESGDWVCWRTGPYAPPNHVDEIEELFVNSNSTPISYELFVTVSQGGAWPEDVTPIEVVAELPPHEAASAELKGQQDAAKAWLLGLKDAEGKGRKPASQEEADKAANYGNAFHAIEKKVEKLREAEKAPHLVAAAEVDAKWVPTREAAKAAKTWAKKLSDDFAIAETARRKREADEENARRQSEFAAAMAAEDARVANEERLRAKGVMVPEFAPPPRDIAPPKAVVAEPVRVGTSGKRQSLRTIPTYEIDDASALLRFLADRNVKSPALLGVALKDAQAFHEAGIAVPGLKVGSREEMQ